MTAFFERISECPPIFDETRGADLLDSLAKAFEASEALAPAALLLQERPEVRQLLSASLSGAPYLAALATRDPGLLAECLVRDPDVHLDEACIGLASAADAATNSKEVM
ncbi:MAG: hypothetical protein WBB50_06055, partial [Methyloceanibacter sp.]